MASVKILFLLFSIEFFTIFINKKIFQKRKKNKKDYYLFKSNGFVCCFSIRLKTNTKTKLSFFFYISFFKKKFFVFECFKIKTFFIFSSKKMKKPIKMKQLNK
jgi:hypothetical protein